jgi:hypothetical protein
LHLRTTHQFGLTLALSLSALAGCSTMGAGSSSSPAPAASSAPAASPAPAPAAARAPAPAPAAAPATSGERPIAKGDRVEVKGINDWSGYVIGKPGAGSKFSRLQIGMSANQVISMVGPEDYQRTFPTGKAFIPFYRGSGRFETLFSFKGQGRLYFASDGGYWRSGAPAALIGIEHDSSEGR